MPKAKYRQVSVNTYESYQISFGRYVRSFPTEHEARAYLETEEGLELRQREGGCWLIKITHQILEKYYK